MNKRQISHMFYLLVLVFVHSAYGQFRTNGVLPTQQMTTVNYFISQQVDFRASLMGVSYFDSTTVSYSIDATMSRQINNVARQNVITSTYEQNYNGEMGYFISSSLASDNTTVRMTLQIVGNSQIINSKFTLITLTSQLLTVYDYVGLFQITVTSNSGLQYIKPPNLAECHYQVFVKSVRIKVDGVLSGGTESFGFKTNAIVSADTTNITIGVEKDNLVLIYHVSVTYLVIVWNGVKYKQTAQFVNLNFVVTSGESLASSATISVPRFSTDFISTFLIGQQQLLGHNPLQPSFTFTLNPGQIIFNTNAIGKFSHSILQVVDFQCPSNAPFKFKGDPNCFSCPGTMIYVNTSEAFNEYRSLINDKQCIRIQITNSGYNYDPLTLALINVCGCCKQCKSTSYLQACECKLCSQKIPNCLECTSDGASCAKCITGYETKDVDNDNATTNSICSPINSSQSQNSPITPVTPQPPTQPQTQPQPSNQPQPPTQPQPQTYISQQQNNKNTDTILYIVLPIVCVIALISTIFFIKKTCCSNQVYIFQDLNPYSNFESSVFPQERLNDPIDPYPIQDENYIVQELNMDFEENLRRMMLAMSFR